MIVRNILTIRCVTSHISKWGKINEQINEQDKWAVPNFASKQQWNCWTIKSACTTTCMVQLIATHKGLVGLVEYYVCYVFTLRPSKHAPRVAYQNNAKERHVICIPLHTANLSWVLVLCEEASRWIDRYFNYSNIELFMFYKIYNILISI